MWQRRKERDKQQEKSSGEEKRGKKGETWEYWNRDKGQRDRQRQVERKSLKLERQRSLSAENQRLFPANRPPTWHPGNPIHPHHFALLRVAAWPHLTAGRRRLRRATWRTLRSRVWLRQSVLARAWFQPRGEGRVPVAEERFQLASTPGSWRCAGQTPPPKAGPENSQLERVESGLRSWKGAGPYSRGSPPRAGGAVGCHKVNGRRRGGWQSEAKLSLSLSEFGSARAEPRAARAQGGGPHPCRVPGPWPLPALQTEAAAAAAGSLPAAGLTVSA